MKKTLISLIAVAAAFLMSSCSKENVSGVSGNEATVSFTIALNNEVATRAVNDETTNGKAAKINQLTYEVYDVNGRKIDHLSKTIPAFESSLTQTVYITLTKGQTYSFAFWAQDKDCTAYTYNDLTQVGVSYENAYGNLENRDAFFGNTEPVMIKGNFEKTVTLKRPFAQLNLAVSDIYAAKEAGILVDQVKVVVSDLATTLNARTGAVSNKEENVTFNLADILFMYPADDEATKDQYLHLEKEITIGNQKSDVFPWMSMNYILVNDETTGAASANANVTFTLTTLDAFNTASAKSEIELYSSNTTLQRNWRTNIIAALTSMGTFNVVIDPIFDGEYDRVIDADGNVAGEDDMVIYGLKETAEGYEVSSAAALVYLADQINGVSRAAVSFTNKTIKLTSDIDLKGYEWTPLYAWEGKLNGVVIDGQGYTISNMSVNGGTSCGFIKDNASSLTIKNLTFDNARVKADSGNGTYAGVVIGKNYSAVAIEKVSVTNSVVINNWQCGGLVGFAETNAPVFTECSISDSFVGGSNATSGAFFGLGGVDITCTKCTAKNVKLYTDMEAGLVGWLYGKTLTATDCTLTDVTVVSEYPAGF